MNEVILEHQEDGTLTVYHRIDGEVVSMYQNCRLANIGESKAHIDNNAGSMQSFNASEYFADLNKNKPNYEKERD